jgi:two-component system NtrC family sensor kinase
MSGTIVIVDDSLTVRMDLAEAFEAAGFQPIPCSTLSEARDAMGRGPVGVVVLDVILPDGDGVEFLREVKASAAGETAAVLMLSTEAEVKDRIRGLQTGADDYVGKPYDTGYVVAKARDLLRTRRAAVAGMPANRALILVIDDSVTFREELRGALEAAGYAVLIAATGEEGLRAAADQRPSAIVVDGVLPGIDGAMVIRRVRLDAALRGVPCLLLTGSEDHGGELRALDAGADAFVRKEEDVDIVLARLAAVMRSAAAAVTTDETASLLGPKNILAVDDSMTYLQELGTALRGEGYNVVLARSGEEALELLAVQGVDCILLDLLMPGLGGKETCRRIKSAPVVRDIPLIMLTALEDRSAMIDGLGAGADDYISKSSEFDVLKARVRAQIRRKLFEDETRRIREDLMRRELEAAEARAARELSETRAALVEELEHKNKELEAFSYSVSHDLRAPLRSIDGFSEALLEDYADHLDETGKKYLSYVRESAQHMGELIDGLLALARVIRGDFRREPVDLSRIAREVAARLEVHNPEPIRQIELVIEEGLTATGDPRLLRVVLENLLGNAWKFTGKRPVAHITFGCSDQAGQTGQRTFFVRDNGAGFDMTYAQKLFGAFQRLHAASEFEGHGIGLATAQRVLARHGGRIWAEGAIGVGATFYFTIKEGD